MFVEQITNLILGLISFLGYFGVFILMVMESMFFPIPSEVVMPFAGFLVAEGRFSFLGVLIASSFGSLVGSLLSYFIGKYGGRPLIIKYGKYILLNKDHLKSSERFFSRKGEITILISRFIPVIRHFISIPAGMARMEFKRFIFYTLIGATAWNTFLTFLGYKFKEKWALINNFSTELDFFLIIILIILVAYFTIKQLKKRK